MNIFINGQRKPLTENRELTFYLPKTDENAPFAVALNGEFIPRSNYAETVLGDGDEIDIVSPVGGG